VSIEGVANRSHALSALAFALAKAGQFAEALLAAVSIEDEGIHAEALSGVAIAQARAGRFLDARSTAASIKNAPSCAEDALRAIASAQAQSGELTGALSTGDMVLVRWAGSIGEVGSAMATLTDRAKARAALNTYLPRAARDVESAWHSCGVVAQLYPERSTDLANFLIGFSRKLSSHPR
jgi:hypothetical protein